MRDDGRRALVAITSQLPWPLDRGGHLRTYHLLRAVAKSFRVTLVTSSVAPEPEGIAALADAGVDVQLARIRQRSALSDAQQVVRSLVRRKPYVLYERHWHAATAAVLSATLKRERPDVLYLDHLDSLLYRPWCDGVPVVMDLHNVYSTLVARLAAEQRNAARRLYLRHEGQMLARMEADAISAADLLFCVSDADEAHFRRCGASAIQLVPNGVDCAAYAHLPIERPQAPPIVLYTGVLSWEPNAEAARFLAEIVLPRVKMSIPDAKLQIVGRAPSQAVKGLDRLASVEVHGDVPSIVPYLHRARVLAVPLASGGGTRLKILEAFAAGVPVLSTPVGCEGLQVEDGRELLIAGFDTYADRTVELLQDPRRAERLASAGRALARQTYDWEVVGGAAAAALKRLVGTPGAGVALAEQRVSSRR